MRGGARKRSRALTKRQETLLLALCQPVSLVSIADDMDMSTRAVRSVMEGIADKVGAPNSTRIVIVLHALVKGFVELEQINLDAGGPPVDAN